MFPNFFRTRGGKDYSAGFVREVTIKSERARDAKFERLIAGFWVVIGLKCAAVWWIMVHYHVPINPLWVVVPTLMFAALCTAVYYWRD
jgi:apolipoprotein N-acyltransferase